MRRCSVLLTGLLFVPGASGHAQQTTATQQLAAWSAEFRRDIIQVAPGVYTAVGYGGSVLSMIVGVDGVVIVDAGNSIADTAEAREAFRKISALPVRAIVYTHGHRDHNTGSPALVEPGAPAPDVWAHAQFGVELGTLQQAGLTINRTRADRQFGSTIPEAQRINNGIGPANPTTRSAPATPGPARPPLPPTRFVTGRTEVRVAGVTLELVPNPGETDDELYVWLPDRRVLFAGDNFYRCLPNLYAIRGTPYRDVRQWADAVEHLLSKDADALVGGHTRPVVGKDVVKEALTDYRDAIRFIFDKTIEGMNRGLTPDELVDYVRLPSRLADKPYLQPYYGRPEWAVRSIFAGYLGWFDGNATTLFPLSPRETARRIAVLAGGQSRLLDAIREALSAGDYQWAAELSDHVLALDPSALDARTLKAEALEALAERTVTATARNYYLSAAQELRAGAEKRP